MTTITGDYKRPDGTIPAGRVTFTLVPAAIEDATGIQVTPGTVTATLDDQGVFTVDLIPDDDLRVDGDAIYRVVESVGALSRSWDLLVADDTAIDLIARYPGTSVGPGAPTVNLSLDGLLDVTAPSPADGEALVWDNTAGEWVNATVVGSGGIGEAPVDGTPYARQDAAWTTVVGGGVSDHGALTGLGDDDHTQYLTVVRGDARYYTETESDAMLAGKSNTTHDHDTDYDVLGAGAAAIAHADTQDEVHSAADRSYTDTTVAAHTGDTTNPHSVTATQVGLGSVDNTTDASKPVSAATQTALDDKVAGPATSVIGKPAIFGDVAGETVTSGEWQASGGDVVGPASAVDGKPAVFSGASGKLIASGEWQSGGGGGDVYGPASSTAGRAVVWADTTGKLLSNAQADHGDLAGLTGDDHAQYHNDARGDARYDSLGSADTAEGVAIAHADTQDDSHSTADRSYTNTQIGTHSGDAGAHHTRYTDTEAVAAVGAIPPAQTYLHSDLTDVGPDDHHTRYSPAEAVSDTAGSYDVLGAAAAAQTAAELYADTQDGAHSTADRGYTDTEVAAHASLTTNPHSVTAAQVGLGSVDNTTDVDKPVSTATQTALDAKGAASAVALNTTHRSSDGSDHTYLNQAVTSTSTPTFATPTADGHAATKGYTDSRIWQGSQVAYDALTPDPTVLYVITS